MVRNIPMEFKRLMVTVIIELAAIDFVCYSYWSISWL